MDWLDKLISACSTLIGMLPPALTGFGLFPLSPLYQPIIYEHKEPFLIIPAIVAIFASWSIIFKPWAMIPVFITRSFSRHLYIIFMFRSMMQARFMP
jgi:hypothetical protein